MANTDTTKGQSCFDKHSINIYLVKIDVLDFILIYSLV